MSKLIVQWGCAVLPLLSGAAAHAQDAPSLFALETVSARVIEVDPDEFLDAGYVRDLTSGDLQVPQDLAFHPGTGDLFVSQVGLSLGIHVFDGETGAFQGVFGETAENTILQRGLAFHPGTQNLFVADIGGAGASIKEFDGQTGEFLGAFGETDDDDSILQFLEFHPETHNLFVTDTLNRVIKEFDGTTGALIRSIGEVGDTVFPVDLTLVVFPSESADGVIAQGNEQQQKIIVPDGFTNDVRVFDLITGEFLGSFGMFFLSDVGQGTGAVFSPDTGKIYVSDGATIKVFDAGTFAPGAFFNQEDPCPCNFSRLAEKPTLSDPPETLPEPASSDNSRQSGVSGDPVDTFTGELVIHEEPDLFLDGPHPLEFSRYYASGLRRAFVVSRIGDNWRHSFDWTIHFIGNTLRVVNHKGRVVQYLKPDLITNEWVQQNNFDVPLQVIQVDTQDDTRFHVFEPVRRIIYEFGVPSGDTAFRLIEIRDERGNALALSYTADGDLEQVTDGLGRTLTLTYDPDPNPASRKLRSVTDGTRTVQFNFDGDLLTSVQDAATELTEYVYDDTHNDSGLLLHKIFPEGNIATRQTWDNRGRVATQTDADQNTTTFAYDQEGGAGGVVATAEGSPNTTITDPEQKTIKHRHNEAGSLTRVERPKGEVRDLAPDGDERRASVDFPEGGSRTESFDAISGYVRTETDGEGATAEYFYATRIIPPGFEVRDLKEIRYEDGLNMLFGYDPSGNRTTRTNRSGETWTTTYNGRGQPLTETNPAGGVITFTYNPDGTRATQTDASSNPKTFGYDGLFRLNQITHADGKTRVITYDALDRITSIKPEDDETTVFVYDKNGNLLRFEDPSGKAKVWSYDDNNRVATRTDRNGDVVTYSYDTRGLFDTAELSGIVESYDFTYDDSGQLTSVGLPNGVAFHRDHDDDGVPTEDTNDLGETETVVLDKDRRVLTRTDQDQNEYTFTYDSIGRMTSRGFPTGHSEIYSFGDHDRLEQIELLGPAGQPIGVTTEFGYDVLGLMTSAKDPNQETWSYVHDDAGRLTTATDPLGRARVLEYDDRNRVSKITYPGSLGSLDATYTGVGQVERRDYSDGESVVFVRDLLGRVRSTRSATLDYDAESRIVESNGLTLTRRAHSGDVESLTYATDKTVTYAYDAAGRVESVTDWMGGGVGFVYDAAGQREHVTRSNGVDTSFTYDGPGRVLSIVHGTHGSVDLVRDSWGRVTGATRNLPTSVDPDAIPDASHGFDAASQVAGFDHDALGRVLSDDRHTYDWSLGGQLLEYEGIFGTVEFAYDGFGMMVERSEAGETRQFVWNYGVMLPCIAVERVGGADEFYYIHDPAGALLYRIRAADGARHFYHFDERGNTVLLTDDAGVVVASYAYAPYGFGSADAAAVHNPFTFVGRYGVMEEHGGLYLMRQRPYDSHTARFLLRESEGPHLHPRSFNPYVYATANPINYFDPAGTDPTNVDEAAQEVTAGQVMDTAADVVRGTAQVFGTRGAQLGEQAVETARAADKAFGASLTLGHEVSKEVFANLGGNAKTQAVEQTARAYEDTYKALDKKAEKLASKSKTFKAVGGAGKALSALEIGQELWKLHGRLGQTREAHDELEISLYQVFIARSAVAWEIFEKGKISEGVLRAKLRVFQSELKLQLFQNDYLSLIDNTVNFWTAVANIYGAFVPGFSLVGAESVSEAAHEHVWAPIHGFFD